MTVLTLILLFLLPLLLQAFIISRRGRKTIKLEIPNRLHVNSFYKSKSNACEILIKSANV